MSAAVIVTTTPNVEGKKITSYRGIVTGEAIMGANIFKDLFAGIRDIVGGRSATYERELRRARDIAMEELKTSAAEMGANAVVGDRPRLRDGRRQRQHADGHRQRDGGGAAVSSMRFHGSIVPGRVCERRKPSERAN